MTETKHSRSEGDGGDDLTGDSRHTKEEPETEKRSRAVLVESGTWAVERRGALGSKTWQFETRLCYL